MKTYIVYNLQGDEVGMMKASSHNLAEKSVITSLGKGASVVGTKCADITYQECNLKYRQACAARKNLPTMQDINEA